MIEIQVAPAEIWEYAQEQFKSGMFGKGDVLGETAELVARSDETDIEIFLSSDMGVPFLVAYLDKEVFDKAALDEENAQTIAEEFYELLSDETESIDDETSDEEIIEREEDLTEAAHKFLAVLTDGLDLDGEVFENLKMNLVDFMGEYLAKGWGISVYRPVKFADDSGEEFVVEFPYESMVEESGWH